MKIPKIIELVRNNIVQHNHPLGLKVSEISGWGKHLNLKTKGEVLIYTGGEYQLLPLLDSLSSGISFFQPDSRLFNVGLGIREIVGKVGFTPEKIYGKLLSKDPDRYTDILKQAALMLQNSGVDLCYLGDKEIYSGALLLEFGYKEDFTELAGKLGALLKETGAKTIICMSPHSAEMFKYHYSAIDDWFKQIEILTYTEYVLKYLSKEAFVIPTNLTVTIQDSCKMVRELSCSVEIREFFQRLNIKVIEPLENSNWTICCGGPSKIMFPQLADCLGKRRFTELNKTGADVVLSFCPYCLAALEKGKEKSESKIRILDFVEFLQGG